MIIDLLVLSITIKSPQIIGWISQMVPALPRLNKAQQDQQERTLATPKLPDIQPEPTEPKTQPKTLPE